MTTRFRYRTKQQQLTQHYARVGYGLIALVILAIAGAGVFFATQARNRKSLDETTMCPKGGPESITVIVIDRSEPLKPVQQELLRKHLVEVKEAIPRFGSVVVYTVGSTDKAVLAPEVMICNPGRAEDVSEWTANPKRLEKKWKIQFSEKLDEIFARLVEPVTDQVSPLMETVQSVAATSLADPHVKDVPIRLVVVSDFIHNTAEYNQYRGVEPFSKFKELPYFRRVQADLHGAEVEMYYILRDTRQRVQSPAHVQFWRDYFTANKGVVVHYLPI